MQLKIVYRTPTGSPRRLTVHPLGLVQRGPVSYLVATTFDYDDAVLYALHRIKSASCLDADVKKPEGFDIRRYAEEQGHFGSGKPITLKARVSDYLAAILAETPLGENQNLSSSDVEGWRLLTAKVRDTWQLRWWILSHADSMRIERPAALRKDIAAAIRRAAALNAPSAAPVHRSSIHRAVRLDE